MQICQWSGIFWAPANQDGWTRVPIWFCIWHCVHSGLDIDFPRNFIQWQIPFVFGVNAAWGHSTEQVKRALFIVHCMYSTQLRSWLPAGFSFTRLHFCSIYGTKVVYFMTKTGKGIVVPVSGSNGTILKQDRGGILHAGKSRSVVRKSISLSIKSVFYKFHFVLNL